jgi:GNAT superfamily N-acetyltransferase
MGAFTIRHAGEADLRAVVAAYHWLFAPPGATPPGWDDARAEDTLRSLLEEDAETFALLVADAGAIVGLCTVYLDIRSVRFGRRAWVDDLAVDPDRRSLGIGKGLLDAAKTWARERGASHLELDSAFGRTGAHRLYERENPSRDARSFGWVLR